MTTVSIADLNSIDSGNIHPEHPHSNRPPASSTHLTTLSEPAATPLAPLPKQRPVLLVGHGSRDADGRQRLLDFAQAYQELDTSRPVVPCFLELCEPTIMQGVERCVELGYTDLSVLPILLFAARHNKFDVTNELDRARQQFPQVTFHYGRHFGITPNVLDLWRSRLHCLDQSEWNPHGISRENTVLLFVGRGSSDPDANGDVAKLARLVWEGSGYATVETCFIGITHPRLEEGFRRARLYQPKRIIVLPYFLFTGTLMKKIATIAEQQQAHYPEIETICLPEMGLHPQLFHVLRQREIETQENQVNMNCEMCKFRLMALSSMAGHAHDHGSGDKNSAHPHDSHTHDSSHAHAHHHGHHHHGEMVDPYAEPTQYHQRIWNVP